MRLSQVLRSLINRRNSNAIDSADADAESLDRHRTSRNRNTTLVPDNLPPRSLENIRIHLKHASVDIGMSLVSFAIVINSAILIVAAAAFYYTPNGTTNGQVIVASYTTPSTCSKTDLDPSLRSFLPSHSLLLVKVPVSPSPLRVSW